MIAVDKTLSDFGLRLWRCKVSSDFIAATGVHSVRVVAPCDLTTLMQVPMQPVPDKDKGGPSV